MRRSVPAIATLLLAALAAPAATPQERSLSGLSGHDFARGAATRLFMQQAQFGAGIIGRTLSAGLVRSRDAARATSEPIPDDIRAALTPYFPDAILDSVRYSIGDTTPDGLAGFAIRNGNAAAVTLIDTVVFSSDQHIQNLALWAHELHHVEQYAEWGVEGFSERYAFNWNLVEADARARAQDFIAWYKAQTGN